MGVYINMEMPSTGLYFASVDNTGGRDKTVVTVERMLGNRDVRQIVGSFELVPVPPHGRLIDADANLSVMRRVLDNPYTDLGKIDTAMLKACIKMFEEAPTVIEAEEGE